MEYLVNVVPSGEIIDESLLPPNITNGIKPRAPAAREKVIENVRSCDESTGSAGITVLEDMERQMIEEALSRHKNKKLARRRTRHRNRYALSKAEQVQRQASVTPYPLR